MPYIPELMRDILDPVGVTAAQPETEGELNFAITSLCEDFLGRKGLNYANINAVIGVLECAKLEFYRRVAAPYEDSKILQNGDVYPENLLTKADE